METQVENSGLDVISKQEIDSKMPDEIAGGIIEPASVTIKKEIIDTELNPSVPDFENFIGNNDPINIKSEDIHTIIDNSHEEETYQHMMIGAEIMSEDESEEKTLHLKGEVIDMELENVKEEPAEKYSESSEDESHIESNENSGYTELSGHPKIFKCNTCDYFTARRHSMKKHTKVHNSSSEQAKHLENEWYIEQYSGNAQGDSESRKFVCKKCSFRSSYKWSISRHLLTHSDVTDKQTTEKMGYTEVSGHPKIFKCNTCDYFTARRHSMKKHTKVHNSPSEQTMQPKNEGSNLKQYSDTAQADSDTAQADSDSKKFACKKCSFRSSYKWSISRHLLTHSDVTDKQTTEKMGYTEVNVYPQKFKCNTCDYQTARRYNMKQHTKVHDSSSEQTKHPENERSYLEQYCSTAQADSVRKLSCKKCSFTTRYKWSMSRHLLTHSDVTVEQTTENSGLTKVSLHPKKFKCNTCDYRTARRFSMKKHTKVHNSANEPTINPENERYLEQYCSIAQADSESKKYVCKKCSFTTRYKWSVARHLLTHLDITDKYNCDHCDYETNNKLMWEIHVGTHKPKKKILHRCSLCPYTSKLKTGVTNHMTVHKKPSETTMYECELCPYKAKWPHCLRNHLKTHKKKELPVHKCQHCDFQANNKYSVATHDAQKHQERVHKVFKCSICDYQGRRRRDLRNHVETHKALSERQTFYCAQCDYKNVRKANLKRHLLLKHVNLTQFESEKKLES